MIVNGRWGAVLPWLRGNDGLTWYQRRASARRWARGAGRVPTPEQSRKVYEELLRRREKGHEERGA